ncbi:glucan biosynthesis protein [Ferrovum sp.]|uniref:glucan biosynthesis protein n=1 Tax=Ferrovum sp. TaxID=2609467 RepID=UPI0026063E44|nr:glucan biosynthesis protein D [Ferrovum sp.]
MSFLNRRHFMGTLATLLASPFFTRLAQAEPDHPDLGPGTAFSWEGLCAEARKQAQQPYAPPLSPDAAIVDRIDWDAHSQIHFKMDHALFADGPGDYAIAFFHPGKFFPFPVKMYRLDQPLENEHARTEAREVLFDRHLFDMPEHSPARELSHPSGFAGFRIQESRSGSGPDWRSNDWAAFLGASYFRAIGDEYQYGLSARGVSVNTGTQDQKEEFPLFTHFYFAPPQPGSREVSVYALLDGPSLSGAYHFTLTRNKAVLMDVQAELFLRRDIAHFGLAPMTSMYWFSDKDKTFQEDWRPQVHDSDGLSLWTGSNEHIWRPLINPSSAENPKGSHPPTFEWGLPIEVSHFSDENPKGFGLIQRERHFDQYLDAVHYERRPSLWIEPLNAWGKGTVRLVELHTTEELYDNVVAMWVPAAPARAGSRHSLRYRLYWQADEPFATTLARCVGTGIGRGGEPGHRLPGVHKFEVVFQGGELFHLPAGSAPEAVVTPSRGRILSAATEPVPNGQPGLWRALFDLAEVKGSDPVEIRLYLKRGNDTLSETWLYHYLPT